MASLVKIQSTENDHIGRRLIKFLRLGKSDIRESKQISPYGFDSNPVKNMIGIYSETEVKGKSVIVGYINVNQLAEVGESRMFSTDENGNLKFFVWAKNDGTLQLGGTTNHLATFEGLKSGVDQLKTDLNNLISAFNTHVHATAAVGPPSSPTPGSGVPATPSTASIDSSKIDEITTL